METTYKGVPIPEVLRPNWDQPEAIWWRRGVEAAQEQEAKDYADWMGPGFNRCNEESALEPKAPLDEKTLREGVIPDLTDAEIDGFIEAINE